MQMRLRTKRFLSVAAAVAALTSTIAASNVYAQAPVGNANASIGGTFTINLGAEPTTLNPITGSDAYTRVVTDHVVDTLLKRNPETYEWTPALAEKYEVSPDGKTYTFTIRKGAVFHDGKPVTAEDVKFSFEAIFDAKYNAAHMRPYFDNFDQKVEVIDPHTVRFTAKTKYFGNLEALGDTMLIVPKHVYGDAEAGRKKNKTIVASGPYKLSRYDQGQSILLERNKDWWGWKVEAFKGRYNFNNVRMRFIKEENISLESLKKGQIDYEAMTPEAFTKKTTGPEWGKSVVKVKTENSGPKPYGYIGMNLRKDMFKERDVRLALYMLMNRDEMNKKFFYDMSIPATGPWYQQSEYADPNVKAVKFDPKKAVELLKKVGWVDSDKNGILDRTVNGKKTEFRFTLIYGAKDSEKYWVFFQSDLRKVGIDMQLQLLEWNALLKKVDEADTNPGAGFDALALAWSGGSVDLDPKQIWHSSSIGKGGSNFIGYKNPEVDKLIDEARQELDKKKRIPMLRKVFKTIADDVPYLFFFNPKYALYGHTSRIQKPKPTFKYEVGNTYWWAADAK